MAKIKTGLSREFIIHPGETLKEILENRNMTQNELALRTGVSPKHISKVLSQENSISYSFAKKLEYAFDIDKQFWINLQEQYEKDLLEYNELNSITKEEFIIAEKLDGIIHFLQENNYLNTVKNNDLIMELRHFCKVSNLQAIPDIITASAYKINENIPSDDYNLFAWQTLCEKMAEKIEVEEITYSQQKSVIKSFLPHIKALMSFEAKGIVFRLQEVLAKCGIAFCVAPDFPQISAVGFIKQVSPCKTIMCITIDESNPEKFWFTVFHELAHILNGDVKNQFTDQNIGKQQEEKADKFARMMMTQ